MHELRFYVEQAKYAGIKKLLGILGMLPGILLVFTGLLKAMGEHNKFVKTCVKLSIPAGIIAGALIGAAIYVYYKYRLTFTITMLPQGGLQFVIRDPDGQEHGATGRWSWHALYTKHYHKWGTYRKELYLVLFCNDQFFCTLRHEVAPAFPAPGGFREVNSGPDPDARTYFTKKTEEVFGLIRSQQAAPQYRTH